jgi:cytochrome P460
MKILVSLITLLILSITLYSQANNTENTPIVKNSANGIVFPENYQSWDLVAVSHRTDNKTIRAILGNPEAIKAIEMGQTNPWPDGVILGKMVWKDGQSKEWPDATVPAEFVHAEFMFKDSKKWQTTGGWGWARWLGTEQLPFGKDSHSASASCVACHTPVKNNDWVYTKPAIMPKKTVR